MEPPLLSADSVALQGGAAPAAGKGHPACGEGTLRVVRGLVGDF